MPQTFWNNIKIVVMTIYENLRAKRKHELKRERKLIIKFII